MGDDNIDHEVLVASIVAKLEDGGASDDILDELICNTFAEIASNVNSGGLLEQVGYLISEGYTEADIVAAITESEERQGL